MITKIEDVKKFDDLYKGWHYTITGAGGDLNEWVEGYEKLMAEKEIGKPKEWLTFTGAQMNEYYHLTGGNAYPADLTFLAFPLDGLDNGKLAMFKLLRGDRWFTDIVDNNARREGD